MDRFMVVSADCHATATPDGYTEYLEPRYRDAYAEYRGHVAAVMEMFDKGAEDGGRLFSSEAVAEWYGSGIRRAVLERLVQVLDELTAETHRRHEALRRMPRRDGRGVRPKPRT